MKKVFAIAIKDLRLLRRDKGGAFFTLVFPLLLAIFFGTVFSGEGKKAGVSVWVVDEDGGPMAQEFIDGLAADQALQVQRKSADEARTGVRQGKASAYLLLPPGFSAAKRSIFDGDVPRVVLGIDPARSAEEGLLEGVLMKHAAEDMQKAFSEPRNLQSQVDVGLEQLQGVSGAEELQDFLLQTRRLAESSLLFQNQRSSQSDTTASSSFAMPLTVQRESVLPEGHGPSNAYDISFPQGVIWLFLGAISTFSLSLVGERRQGTLARLCSTAVGPRSVLLGKALACFLALVGMAAALIAIGVVAFGIAVTSWALLVLALASSAFCFSGFSLLCACLGRTEKAASGLTWALLMPMAMLGGGMLPLAFMPGWLAALSPLSPVNWLVKVVEGSLWRGLSLWELLPLLGLQFVAGLVFFFVGMKLFTFAVRDAA